MIIDTHVHIGKFFDFDLKPEDVLYSMEQYGIDYSLVSSIDATEVDHEQNPVPKELLVPQTECLRRCLEFAHSNPGKIGAAVWVKPLTETADDELQQMIAENLDVIKAMKVHPFHSKVPFDSEVMEPFIALAEKFSLPVVVHTGGSDEAEPVRVYNSALKHPNVDFVMVHMGLGSDNKQAIDLICRLPNLYGDTTWVPVKSSLSLIEKSSSHKLLFGSDNPIDGKDTYLHNRTGDRSLYQEYFNEFKSMVSADEYEDIMWRNAKRLFKIDI